MPLFPTKEIVSNVVNSLPGFFRRRLRVSHVEQPESSNDEFSSESDLATVESVSQCSAVFWSHPRRIGSDAEAKASKQKPKSCAGRSEHGLEEAISVLKILLRLGSPTTDPEPRSSAGTPKGSFPCSLTTVVILAILFCAVCKGMLCALPRGKGVHINN